MFEIIDYFREHAFSAPVIEVTTDNRVALFAAFGGAIVGALVAGGVQWFISKSSAKRERKNTQWQQAVRAMLHANIIYSDVQSHRTWIHRSLNEANDRRLTMAELWQRLIPLVHSSSASPLDVDSLLPFFEAKEFDLVGRYIEMVQRHQQLDQAIATYSEMRMSLGEKLPRTTVTNEGNMHSEIAKEEFGEFVITTTMLNSLAANIREQTEDLGQLAGQVVRAIGPAAKRIFGEKNFPSSEPIDQAGFHSEAKNPA